MTGGAPLKTLWKHLSSEKQAHYAHTETPAHNPHTHSNTQNKHADSTQHSTHCNNFRGMVSMWRGCGKRHRREVNIGEGRLCCTLSKGAASGQHELMCSYVFGVPPQPPILSWKWLFNWARASIFRGWNEPSQYLLISSVEQMSYKSVNLHPKKAMCKSVMQVLFCARFSCRQDIWQRRCSCRIAAT